MEHSPGAQFHDDEHIHGAEAGRDDHEEVTCHDCFGVVANERQPALFRIGLSPRPSAVQVFSDSAGRDPVSLAKMPSGLNP